MSAPSSERPRFFGPVLRTGRRIQSFLRQPASAEKTLLSAQQLDKIATSLEAETLRHRMSGAISPTDIEQGREFLVSQMTDRFAPPGSSAADRLDAYDSALMSAKRRTDEEIGQAVKNRAEARLEELGLSCRLTSRPTPS